MTDGTLLPKAELHVHLEGTASPDLVRRLAARNGMVLPSGLFDGAGAFVWRDFLHFLEVYDIAAATIRTARDYRDVTYEYLAGVAADGGIYAEVMSSPDHAAQAGLDYPGHVEGIAQGIADAAHAFGIEARLIVTCVRHFGVERAWKVADAVLRHPHAVVTGFGMGGDEAGYPPAPFAPIFERMRGDAGLACTVHAGEWQGPAGIREAIDTLPVSRIGHGVRAIEDAALVDRLAASGVVLEVCPTSNVATSVFPDYAGHPLPRLMARGVRCTISSDDPPYFHTSIGREYDVAAREFGFDRAALLALTRTSIEAAFVDAPTRARLLATLEAAG